MPAWCSRSTSSEVGRHVVAPRTAERVLHDGHELDVREAQVGDVRHQRVGDLVPRVELTGSAVAVGVLPPRREVHLVGRHRLVDGLLRAAGLDPGVVAPLVLGLPDHRGGARRLLGVLGERVGPVGPLPVGAAEAVLVLRPDAGARDVGVPDARPVEPRHRVRGAVPAGPLAGHLDLQGVGRPDPERGAVRGHLGAEHGPELLVSTLTDEVQVELPGCVCRVRHVGHWVPPSAASGMESHPGRLRAS